MASVSDFVFSASHPHVLMGAVTSAALLGYHISLRAESLRELTDLTILNFRSAYSPGAVYEFFDALGQQGKKPLFSVSGNEGHPVQSYINTSHAQ
jgi:hypothetical protein